MYMCWISEVYVCRGRDVPWYLLGLYSFVVCVTGMCGVSDEMVVCARGDWGLWGCAVLRFV